MADGDDNDDEGNDGDGSSELAREQWKQDISVVGM